jgi:hypothetical protein
MTSLEPGTAALVDAPSRTGASGSPSTGPEGTQVTVRRSWQPTVGLAIFASGALTAAVWLMLLGRGLTFFFDEWSFVDTQGQSFWTTDLAPHQGHPVVVPFALYRLVLAAFGIGRYWPYMALIVGVNLLCGWLLFVLLRRRLSPIAAAALASVVMLLGPAWQDLLWPFQIGFLGSVAAGLGALVLLDQRQTRSDLLAAACLTLAVFCSGVGISFLVGVTVELLWRRSSWHRIWVTLAPAALFGVWYLTKGRGDGSTQVIRPGLSAGAHFLGAAAAGVLGASTGQSSAVGGVLAIVLLVLVVAAVSLSPGQSGRLAMAVTGALSFWVLTLLTRGVEPAASRYLYPGAVFVLLAVGELPHLLGARISWGRTRREHAAPTRSRTARLLSVVLVAGIVAYSTFAIWRNSDVLLAGRGGLLGVSQTVRAELGAVQLAGAVLPAGFRPDTKLMPQVTTGPFLAAVAAYGSPGDTALGISGAPPTARTAVDAMLLRALPMNLTPSLPPRSVTSCPESGVGTNLVVTLPETGLWVTTSAAGPLAMEARAFSPTYLPVSDSVVPAGATLHLAWSGAPAPIHWTVSVHAPLAASLTCLK